MCERGQCEGDPGRGSVRLGAENRRPCLPVCSVIMMVVDFRTDTTEREEQVSVVQRVPCGRVCLMSFREIRRVKGGRDLVAAESSFHLQIHYIA